MPLVLTRRKHERIQIGHDIIVEVSDVRGKKEVKLTIFAPDDVVIVRLAPGEGLKPLGKECERCGFFECACVGASA